MRKEYGLAELVEAFPQRLNNKVLAGLLLDDLASCECLIYGQDENDKAVLIVKLTLESIDYELFDQRIDIKLTGDILTRQFTPLTYQVKGKKYSFQGRCSIIRCVCGVDLYLNKSFNGAVGEVAYQGFQISVKALFKKSLIM